MLQALPEIELDSLICHSETLNITRPPHPQSNGDIQLNMILAGKKKIFPVYLNILFDIIIC